MAGKRTRNPEKTRERILDAAAELVARGGAAAPGVNAIASRAGVGKPLVYRYFGDASGVVEALAGREAEQAEKLLEAPAPDDLPVSREVYAMLRFGRVVAASGPLKGLYLMLLGGGLSGTAASRLLALVPGRESDDREAASRALLLAAIAFVALAKDAVPAWAGVPLNAPKHLARLEAALIGLAGGAD